MRILLFSWLFSIPIYSITIISIGAHVVYGRCPEDQQSLLLGLKNNLAFDASLSKKLVEWKENIDYCDWNGVNCSDGCVISIDLSNESISGGIDNSSSLFSFRFLQNLNLGWNRFNSTIPSGFEKLSNLIVLNMSNAGFGGQIPIGISRLSSLVTLDLSSSLILQPSTLKLENPNLKNLVQNLSNLRELLLDGVDLSAMGHKWCKVLSSSLLNLQVLSLSTCSLSGPIDSSLVKLQYLSVIRLNNNTNISSPVPENFAEFSNLTLLHLSNSRLHGVFPESIFQVSSLQTLDLSNNKILQGSFPDFQFNGPLQSLELQGTNFSGSLPDYIGNVENLTRVDLANSNFEGLIPNSIANLRHLEYLVLSENRFIGPIPSFSSMKNLTVLNLAHNRLNGSIHSTKWEVLGKLVNLDLRNNTLTGSIPFSLFHLSSIQKLHLCFNQFNGSLNELSNASSFQLNTLDLESNQLGGPFPLSFFELQDLKILSLSFNNFMGTLDLNILKQLKNLSRLELSYNRFSIETDGTDSNSTFSGFPQLSVLNLASCKLRRFPSFLRNQSSLTFLDLSNNELEGEIPRWIWEARRSLSQLNLSCNSLTSWERSSHNLSSSLTLLDLHSNNFQGPITFFPPSAAYLDFSNNSFSSTIPPEIGKYLSFMVFFSLSRNNIQGSLPESICKAQELLVLDLSYNNLSGQLPQCSIEMFKNGTLGVTLAVLNLRANNFNGSISDTFPVICDLRTLDLNGNNIEGPIPQSLSNCKSLEVLDLGNNHILDRFPCQLKNISTLRILNLRNNKFHGKIGCPGCEGTWPGLQIIDLAQNNFSGDIPRKCLTNWKSMVEEEKLNHLHFNFFKFSSVNYQNTLTVIMKGLEMKLTKITTIFTVIDFSCNQFHGPIPEEIGELRALYILNMSHNSLSGEIPSSIGNMIQLGSLDLSNNLLNGTIPSQLATLTFLSVFNLSYNQLEGKIPIGTQIQSFSPDSFTGNAGLCGHPLKQCDKNSPPSSANPEPEMRDSETEIDWKFMFIGIGLGFPAGALTGIIVGLKVWEKISITLRGYYSIFMFNKKKKKKKKKREKINLHPSTL